MGETRKRIQRAIDKWNEALKQMEIVINTGKTKIMKVNETEELEFIVVEMIYLKK